MKRLILIGLLASACGSSPTAPTPAPIPSTPTTITITGHVSATNGGQPLGGLSAALGATTATTDGSGSFSASMLPTTSLSLALTGTSIVPRTIRIAAMTTRDVSADAITLGGSFDLGFYRQLARNATQGGNEPLRRWTHAPNVYLRTVDDAGAAIDARTLDATESAIRDAVPLWSAGQFQATVQRGTETRERQAGWVTVRWLADANAGKCGVSDVAVDGGTIDLYPRVPNCRCAGGPEIRPRAVRHEIGHTMGFFHTDNPDDLMFVTSLTCDAQPSARELYHARIAYSRPVGNVDPDTDPAGTIALAPLRVP